MPRMVVCNSPALAKSDNIHTPKTLLVGEMFQNHAILYLLFSGGISLNYPTILTKFRKQKRYIIEYLGKPL